MGVLVWGAGWSTWLPLTGVHSPPWEQRSARSMLPVIDHAVVRRRLGHLPGYSPGGEHERFQGDATPEDTGSDTYRWRAPTGR